jgi:hypothetical protein
VIGRWLPPLACPAVSVAFTIWQPSPMVVGSGDASWTVTRIRNPGDLKHALFWEAIQMPEMTPEDYDRLVNILDGRIDKLTKPIPSQQILRFAEAIRSASTTSDDDAATYGDEDYANLLETQEIVHELLPGILREIRARSINPDSGWQYVEVCAGNGDHDLCAICREPFHHFGSTVKIHCLDMHANSFHSVCRECVRAYAPLEFVELDCVRDWLAKNQDVSKQVESDHKREEQRVALIDAIRRHIDSTDHFYFGDIAKSAQKWISGAFGEWR